MDKSRNKEIGTIETGKASIATGNREIWTGRKK